MLNLQGIRTYEEGKQKQDRLTFLIRKAKARGDLGKLMELECLADSFENEGTIEKVRGLMRESASLDDGPNTKMGDLDRYVKPGVTDSEGVTHAVEIEKSGKPLGRVPNGARGREVNKNNAKANRFLKYQETRIKKAIQENNFERATLIGLMLLKNSYSYQLSLLNKVFPQGHHVLSMLEAKKLVEQVVKLCRSSTFRMFITRFYILKADRVRGRPIGCPDYPSRVLSRGINDLIYAIFSEMHKHQHGFSKGRSCGTAIGNVIQNLKGNPKVVYEFDLKSFFNTVDIDAVGARLMEKSSLLAKAVWKIHHSILYRLPKEGLKEEAELKILGADSRQRGNIPILQRNGMPQGLSISPVLSILSLELGDTPKGVDMYADDGIYCGDSMDKFNAGTKQISYSGVELAANKSHPAGRYIDFLGCIIDRFERTVSFGPHYYSWDNPDLKEILQKIYNGYGSKHKEKSGVWFVNPGSFTAMHNPGISDKANFPLWDWLIIGCRSIFRGLPHMGYRYFPGKGIIDIIGGSSYACNWMLSIKKELNLGAIKPLCLDWDERQFKQTGIEDCGTHKRTPTEYVSKRKLRANRYFELVGHARKNNLFGLMNYG